MKFNSTLSNGWQLTVPGHYGLATPLPLSSSSPPPLPISTSPTPSPPPLPPSPSHLPHRPLLSPCLPLLPYSPSISPPLHQIMLSCLVTIFLWLLYCTDWKNDDNLRSYDFTTVLLFHILCFQYLWFSIGGTKQLCSGALRHWYPHVHHYIIMFIIMFTGF